MKRLIISLFSVLIAIVLGAEERSVEKAGQIAQEFFATKAATKASDIDLRMVWDGTMPHTRSLSADPAFYLFDNASGPGFVIVSGDDRARTILGYSFDSELDPNDLPPHFIGWMKEIENEIEYIRANSAGVQVKSDIDVGSKLLKLETAKWNQGAPYNLLCPLDVKDSKRSVVGCVATATAIVMRYHKWPDTAVGTTPAYTVESTGLSVPANTLGTYDWDKMPLTFPKTGYSSEHANEVAKLMLDCGTMIKMSYSSSASSASTSSVPAALQQYMKYDKSSGIYQKGVYSLQQWHKLLENQLNNYGPVIYAAQNDFGGHCFVLDGYTSKNYYSVNWGWGGSANGWFALDGMNPDDPGIGGSPGSYTQNQYAVFNVKKDEGGVQEVRAVLGTRNDIKGLKADRTEFEPGVPFKISSGLLTNVMTINYVGKMGFAVADKDDNVVEIVHQFNADLKPNYGYYFTDREFKFTTELDFGYRLIAIIWDYQNNVWKKIPGNAEKGIVDYIPLYDQYYIDESTGFSFNTQTRIVTLSVKSGVTVALFDPAGEDITSSVTVQDKKAIIDTKALAPGRYRVALTKGQEFKEFYFTTGSKEVSNE